ncbi:cupin domain-containing protein [Rhodococcus sp. JS3073]|uniref:cupin domain-containing protein n=1 Tax=Rhodococcus sp. JS3073 TaxID=3002901 RepID=UPI0022860FB3|nr:cupin domain-containing protein [Rhodococcus sp. JS3073]WAM19183.1 cupin domain-containing protein [Rhodococcus sp. JS3073]
MNQLSFNNAIRTADHDLDPQPVASDQSIDGGPRTGTTRLGTFSNIKIGLWEMTPGVMSDVEVDEVFVVLSGSATVEFADGTAAMQLRPGDVARLEAGAATVWTVTETLRKVYLS